VISSLFLLLLGEYHLMNLLTLLCTFICNMLFVMFQIIGQINLYKITIVIKY
jgi:hypothetical protein